MSIAPNAHIRDNCCINGVSVIGHDVVIGENCQIGSMSIIYGGTVVGDNVYVGVSASIRDHIEIGNNAIISMGAVVLKCVGPNKIAIGNPAREIAENKDGLVFR